MENWLRWESNRSRPSELFVADRARCWEKVLHLMTRYGVKLTTLKRDGGVWSGIKRNLLQKISDIWKTKKLNKELSNCTLIPAFLALSVLTLNSNYKVVLFKFIGTLPLGIAHLFLLYRETSITEQQLIPVTCAIDPEMIC